MTETIKTIPKKPLRYQFGLKRKKIFDIKKERGDVFEYQGKKYICDGFLPSDDPKMQGIFATEIE
jgi:hypothetical protein